MLSGLALLLVPAKIDFEVRATSVNEIVKQLAAKTGEKLEASGPITQQILLVKATQADPADLKAKIAEAAAATWITDGNRQILKRLPKTDQDIFNDHVQSRLKSLSIELDKIKKQLETPFTAKNLALGLVQLGPEPQPTEDRTVATKYYVRQKQLFEQGPMARLVKRLVLACRPEDLARSGIYSRALFRSHPSKLQCAFDTAKYQAALQAYVKEQQAWIDAATGMDFGEDKNGRMVSDPRSQLRNEAVAQDFGLDVHRGDMAGLFMVNLVGSPMSNGSRNVLAQSDFAGPERDFMNAAMNPTPPAKDDPLVELSPDSKEFQQRITGAYLSRTAGPLTPRMRELILSPDRIDPLSLIVTDGFLAYGRKKQVNIVASLPDDSVNWVFFASREQPLRIGEFIRTLTASGLMQLREDSGWTVATPQDRYESELKFTPRRAIANLMKTVDTRGTVDIRDYAKYAFDSGRISRTGLGDTYLALDDRSLLSALDRTDWQAMRLYGSLNQDQQKIVENGGNLPLNGFNAAQRAIVDRMVYKDEIHSETMRTDGSFMYGEEVVEPTERYADGVPATGVLAGRGKTTDIIAAYCKDPKGNIRPSRPIDIYTLATVEVQIKNSPDAMQRYGLANLVGYAPGKSKTLILRLQLEPKVWLESLMTMYDFDKNATPVTWDKLPEDTVSQIKTAIDQVKTNNAGSPNKIPPP